MTTSNCRPCNLFAVSTVTAFRAMPRVAQAWSISVRIRSRWSRCATPIAMSFGRERTPCSAVDHMGPADQQVSHDIDNRVHALGSGARQPGLGQFEETPTVLDHGVEDAVEVVVAGRPDRSPQAPLVGRGSGSEGSCVEAVGDDAGAVVGQPPGDWQLHGGSVGMCAKDCAGGGGQRPATGGAQRGLLDWAERTELAGIADEDQAGEARRYADQMRGGHLVRAGGAVEKGYHPSSGNAQDAGDLFGCTACGAQGSRP